MIKDLNIRKSISYESQAVDWLLLFGKKACTFFEKILQFKHDIS